MILNHNILIQVKGVAVVMLFGQTRGCLAGFYFPAVLECTVPLKDEESLLSGKLVDPR